MKTLKNIFIGLFVSCMLVCVMPVFAADNGCDDDNNDAIVAELALCSTHVYNIGETENKTGENRELMRDVIALKTTLITQQMYKQYEQMESMLRRLKTQLEKAVLTTSLEAKGASSSGSSSSGSSFKSGNRNVYIAEVRDCNNELTSLKVFECLNQNLTTIYNASKNGSNLTTELRKQLAQDFKVMNTSAGTQEGLSENDEDDGETYSCDKYKDLGRKKRFQNCLDKLRAGIRKGYEVAQQSAQKQKKE